MRIIGCDLHTRQQAIAMLDDQTGELVEKQLNHEGEGVSSNVVLEVLSPMIQ